MTKQYNPVLMQKVSWKHKWRKATLYILGLAFSGTSQGSEYSSSSRIITRFRHFEFLGISADRLRLLLRADHQGNGVFLFTKGILPKIMHKSNRCFKLELEWAFFSYNLP